jgi:hypothetical protein
MREQETACKQMQEVIVATAAQVASETVDLAPGEAEVAGREQEVAAAATAERAHETTEEAAEEKGFEDESQSAAKGEPQELVAYLSAADQAVSEDRASVETSPPPPHPPPEETKPEEGTHVLLPQDTQAKTQRPHPSPPSDNPLGKPLDNQVAAQEPPLAAAPFFFAEPPPSPPQPAAETAECEEGAPVVVAATAGEDAATAGEDAGNRLLSASDDVDAILLTAAEEGDVEMVVW